MRRQAVRWIPLSCILLLACLTGCDPANSLKKITPPEDETLARNYIDQLRQHQFGPIEEDLNPILSGQGSGETLTEMADMFPDGEPVSIKVVGASVYVNQAVSTTNLTLEYEFPQQWLIANVATQKIDGVSRIIAFNVSQIPDSVENLNKFTFFGRGVVQYAVLLLAVTSTSITLYAFVLCLRTKMQKRKWLWLIAIFIGIGQLNVVWTNGQTTFHLFWLQILPAGATAVPYGPWMIYVSLPLGALIFLLARKRGLFSQSNMNPSNTAPQITPANIPPIPGQADPPPSATSAITSP